MIYEKEEYTVKTLFPANLCWAWEYFCTNLKTYSGKSGGGGVWGGAQAFCIPLLNCLCKSYMYKEYNPKKNYFLAETNAKVVGLNSKVVKDCGHWQSLAHIVNEKALNWGVMIFQDSPFDM